MAPTAAGDDRVNVAALRDMTDDSGGRTEIVRDAARSQSGDREHRRRVEQAVLPGLSVDRKEGRPLALDPRRVRRAPIASARAAATWRADATAHTAGLARLDAID